MFEVPYTSVPAAGYKLPPLFEADFLKYQFSASQVPRIDVADVPPGFQEITWASRHPVDLSKLFALAASQRGYNFVIHTTVVAEDSEDFPRTNLYGDTNAATYVGKLEEVGQAIFEKVEAGVDGVSAEAKRANAYNSLAAIGCRSSFEVIDINALRDRTPEDMDPIFLQLQEDRVKDIDIRASMTGVLYSHLSTRGTHVTPAHIEEYEKLRASGNAPLHVSAIRSMVGNVVDFVDSQFER